MQKGQDPPILAGLANALILNKVKSALGMDKCKLMLYGAAPIK